MLKKQMKKAVITTILLSSITLVGCATSDLKNLVGNGNAVSTSSEKLAQVNPNKVKLFYSSSDKPKHYKVIGRVAADNYTMIGMEHTQATIAEELKKQAGSIGANGVIQINAGLAQTTGDAVVIK